ncbi:YebG family protein [Desulfobacterales bacterium HSG16]|nr:YebG family protein [Desulfobacterales bacterium HSG16]
MAVIIKYIVVRNGVEKMTFTTKKEADAYDKMLDIADNLYEFLETADIDMDEQQLEDLSLFLAQNKDSLIPIMKGIKPKEKMPSDQEPEQPNDKEKNAPKKNAPKKNEGEKKAEKEKTADKPKNTKKSKSRKKK